MMMNAQQQLSQKCMPVLIEEPKTKKQTLRNDIITFLAEKGCQWRSTEVSSDGAGLISALTDTFWAIDGHHHVFASQGYQIPAIFCKFVGYNRPELSKHRKREFSNLSGSMLQSLSLHLFHCLQGSYWHRGAWVSMQGDIEQLAQSLAKYTDYLQASRKKTKLQHSLTSPVHELSTNLRFEFLPIRSLSTAVGTSSQFESLDARLAEMPDYQYVLVEDTCPTDSRAKYNFLQTMKTVGFRFPKALMSYAHGNNVGNVHFVWRVSGPNESSFIDSQRVIERAKESIPVYHTRAMRKEMFGVFGRLTPSLKPAVFWHIYRVFTGGCVLPACTCIPVLRRVNLVVVGNPQLCFYSSHVVFFSLMSLPFLPPSLPSTSNFHPSLPLSLPSLSPSLPPSKM